MRALILIATVCWPVMLVAQGAPQGAVVRVGTVRSESVQQRRSVIGQVEPARRSAVAAEESGLITHAPPEPGVPVQQGQVLARIDDVILQTDHEAADAAVDEARAKVAEQKAELEISQRSLERLEDLIRQDVAQSKEVEDARSRAAADQARLQLAEAELRRSAATLRRTETRLAKTQIKAPFDAYVVRKSAELGQWVDAGAVICELVEITRLKVRLHVPQDLIPHLEAEDMIPLSIDALDHTIDAPLFSIIPDADVQARTFAILIKLDNPEGLIKPGMSVSAQLPTGRTVDAMTVPRDAVQTTPTGTVVFANRGGSAALVPVVVRFGHGDRFVVSGNLAEGEQVVVEGNERLSHGQLLRIVGEVGEPHSRAAVTP